MYRFVRRKALQTKSMLSRDFFEGTSSSSKYKLENKMERKEEGKKDKTKIFYDNFFFLSFLGGRILLRFMYSLLMFFSYFF